MLENPMDILNKFPVRKNRKQKTAFIQLVCGYLEELGYICCVEKGSGGSRNVVAGDPASAKHLITAHYDSCAGLVIPTFITPCNLFMLLAYNILLAVVIFLPAILFSVAVVAITNIPGVGNHVFLFAMLATVLLVHFSPIGRYNAYDNASGVVTLLEIAKSMPKSHRNKVCFILFDMGEVDFIGSASYRDAHKTEINNQLVWNLDCVGEGDEIVFFPSRKVIKDAPKMEILCRCETQLATKSVFIQSTGFRYYPSDYMNFPYGVGIAALKRGKYGLYLGKIPTKKATSIDETNVNILRAAIVSAISCQGV